MLKAGGRYVLPPDEVSRANGDFGTLAQFVREMRPAGASITVLRTTIGAAQSVAVAIDKAEWPEVVGTISGDDTIFIATATLRDQQAPHRAPALALPSLTMPATAPRRAPSPSSSPIPAASTPPSWCRGWPRTSSARSSP